MFGKNRSFQDAGFTLMVPVLYMKSIIFMMFFGISEYSTCGSFMILSRSSGGLLSFVSLI